MVLPRSPRFRTDSYTVFSMNQAWTLFLTCMVAITTVLSQATQEFVSFIGDGIQKEVAAAKHPIEESLVFIGSSQCKNVKKLIGVSYEQIKGEQEPDLNALTLVFKTKKLTTIMNLTYAVESLHQARSFQSDQAYIIYVHGFTDDPSKDSFGNISDSYFKKGITSVIALDGSPLIKWLYLRSTTYVRFMGRKLGELLANLVASGVSPANIHIIGHSLGAHISGFAGKTFYNLTGHRVGRLSALDPAGPCFSHIDPELRVHRNDAVFVVAIHTDGGVYGLWDAVGHVDFYPNSGSMQPNCLSQSCSHSRGWLYFAESVLNETAFPAVRCKNWEEFRKGQCEKAISYMGYPTKNDTRGKFYLQTRGEQPYGLGLAGTKYTNNDAVITNIANLFG